MVWPGVQGVINPPVAPALLLQGHLNSALRSSSTAANLSHSCRLLPTLPTRCHFPLSPPMLLQGHLDSALRSSSAAADLADMLGRVDAKLGRAMDGDTGWEVFSLQYTVRWGGSPLPRPGQCTCL